MINFSVQGTHVPISNVRKQYSGILLGGLDEERFRSLSSETLRSQYESARRKRVNASFSRRDALYRMTPPTPNSCEFPHPPRLRMRTDTGHDQDCPARSCHHD